MSEMREIVGGVCAAKGFKANGVHCGIRASKGKRDLSLIVSDVAAEGAAVYTRNLVKGAPLAVTKNHLATAKPRAIICNSGNANTCNADGLEIAEKMCAAVAEKLGLAAKEVLVASTGVIGQPLPMKPILEGIPGLVSGLSTDGSGRAEEGIMTTDTRPKEVAVEFELGGKICRLGGIAKGSGMIHPNLATMLVFLTTDAAISAELLQKALSGDVTRTFNMVSVDGDTSTNDNVILLANGLAGNVLVTDENSVDFQIFMKALNSVTVRLCRMIAGDGEGATRLMECYVTGAESEKIAQTVAKSVICSSLLKAAIFGSDANWGRVLCAIGYAGVEVPVEQVAVSFRSAKGEILVCQNGAGVPFSEEKAKEILLEKEIDILISLGNGQGQATAWGCDLTYDYVKINGDYRS